MRSAAMRRMGMSGWACAAAILALSGSAGCAKKPSAPKVVEMGSAAAAGGLSYTVTHVEWAEQLVGADAVRTPTARFLMVTVTVANKGNAEAGIPLAALLDKSGKEYLELDKGEGVPQWMGLLRSVNGGAAVTGTLLFDVPPASYQLRVSSGGDVEKEEMALVNLPYKVEAPAPASPAMGIPEASK